MIIHTHRRAKIIKKIFIWIGILLVLSVVAGMAYVYFVDRNATVPDVQTSDKPRTEASPIPEPVAPGPNAPAGAAISYLASPVKAGENSTVSVHTNPRALCKIAVLYNEVPSKDSGLVDKTADVHGTISWAWTVDKTAPAGKWPVKINCSIGAKSVFVQGDLVVTN